MSRQKPRSRPMTVAPTAFDQARDELFQHVMRCGVIGSAPEHQTEWFDETMKYFGERYHELNAKQIADLRLLGQRFAAPTLRPTPTVEPIVAASSDEDEATEGELDTVNAA